MNIIVRALLPIILVASHSCFAGSPEVLDFFTKRDLELVGSVNQSHSSVAAAIDKTRTKAGSDLLHQLIESPLTDIKTIRVRQAAIEKLVENPACLMQLEKLLHYVAVHEKTLTFFNPATTPESLSAVIKSFMYQTSFLESWNEEAFALNARHTLQSFSPLITTAFEFLVLHFAMEYWINSYKKPLPSEPVPHVSSVWNTARNRHRVNAGHDHMHGDSCGCVQHIEIPEGAPTVVHIIGKLFKAGHIALHAISIKDMIEFVSMKMEIMNQVYQQLCALQAVVDAVSQVEQVFSGQHIGKPVGFDLSLLNNHLADGYFSQKIDTEGALHFFSPVGQTLVTYAAIQKNSAHVANIKNFIAHVDIYCSVARLMLDAKNGDKQFCFAEFLAADHDNVPLLVMQQGWHVMLAQHGVVANDFVATSGTALKYTLTGPNRSGKSSLLRTLGVNTALAQTFGIAAAKSFALSPFSKIMSFMTVTDDITVGQSSYVARMMRADACIKMQAELANTGSALVLLDDSLGQATTAARGEEMAYKFVSDMGLFDNNILLCATHIAKLTQLEEETHGRFKNVRMKIVKHDDGKATETYTLEPGISDASDAGILVGQA